MGFLSFLSQAVLRSVFLKGEVGCRRCGCLLKLPSLALMVALPYLLGPAGSLASSLGAVYLYLITAPESVPAALALSSLVTLWFSATGAATSHLLGGGALETGVRIALRTFPLSLAGQAALLCFSPWAAGHALSRISPPSASYPVLVWRLAPQALADSALAMEVQRARGRGPGGALAAALAAAMERREGILLANLSRLGPGARRGLPPPSGGWGCAPLLAALLALTLIGLL